MNSLINDNTELNNSVIDNDIEFYIDLFCNDHDIDKSDIRPQQWTAILSYISNQYIKPNKILYMQLDRIPYKRYNLFSVNRLLDIYIDVSNLYNQSITVLGFSKLSDISMETIYRWKNDNSKSELLIHKDGYILNELDILKPDCNRDTEILTISPNDIYKKLIENIEQNINDMVIDGRRRGVGPIVRFNKFYETHSTAARDHGKQQLDNTELALQLGIDTKLLAIQGKKPAAGVLPDRVPGVTRQNK